MMTLNLATVTKLVTAILTASLVITASANGQNLSGGYWLSVDGGTLIQFTSDSVKITWYLPGDTIGVGDKFERRFTVTPFERAPSPSNVEIATIMRYPESQYDAFTSIHFHPEYHVDGTPANMMLGLTDHCPASDFSCVPFIGDRRYDEAYEEWLWSDRYRWVAEPPDRFTQSRFR